MNSMPIKARVFILSICILGSISLLGQLRAVTETPSWPTLLFCCVAAALLQIFKIEGATERSSYNLSWIVYGFAFINLGPPSTMLVILVAHLFEWAWYRYPWYIQSFNIATFALALSLANFVFEKLNTFGPPPGISILSIVVAFASLTFVNHLLVGLAIRWARQQTFSESGILNPFSYLMDLGLLAVGALTAIVWRADPFSILLVILVLFLLYRALMVPSLRRQAELDAKTDVYNMSYFNVRFEEEIMRAKRLGRSLCIVMADLDHLRDINNTYGHLAGDLVIHGVAAILKNYSRDFDVVARFGGEEFVILMTSTSVDEAEEIAESMRGAIERADFGASSDPTPIRATMSFGVAEYSPESTLTPRELTEQADQALYDAKRQGRNRVCLFEDVPSTHDLPSEAPTHVNDVVATPQSSLAADKTSESSVQLDDYVESVTPAVMHASSAQPRPEQELRKWPLPLYVGILTAIVLTTSLLLVRQSTEVNWQGILLFAVLAVVAELSNLEIYAKQTSVSTSAIPLIAGALLFGPISALCIGVAIAVAAWIKYRSPLVRLWFNTNNHVLGGLLCAGVVMLTGRPFQAWSLPVQAGIILVSGVVLYFSTTTLVAGAIACSEWRFWLGIWKERFSWLGLHYVALAVVSFGLIASYQVVGGLGIAVILTPLFILRYSQKQYIDHTEAMVGKLQENNAELSQRNQEIESLNEEMLNLLAAVLDLRDPAVHNHSSQVALYAVEIAKELRLPSVRIEQIRRAGLLHDIGKLAIPESVLFKSAKLTEEEYDAVKEHPDIGARILAEFHSFHSVIDFVRHHHEHYDGSGYPDGLTGTQIPLEARILGLADAVEAMASSRPYHRPVTADEVKNEVMDCSGTHFDPEIVEAFLKVLNRLGDNIIVDSSNGVVVIESDSSDSTEASLSSWSDAVPTIVFNPATADAGPV